MKKAKATEAVQLELPTEIWAWLREQSRRTGETIDEVVTRIISDEISIRKTVRAIIDGDLSEAIQRASHSLGVTLEKLIHQGISIAIRQRDEMDLANAGQVA